MERVKWHLRGTARLYFVHVLAKYSFGAGNDGQMVSHAGLPLGSRLWTFGSPRHVDGDGWTATVGSLSLGKGYVDLRLENGKAVLSSPADQVIRPLEIRGGAVVYRSTDDIKEIVASVNVDGRQIALGLSDIRTVTLADGIRISTFSIRWAQLNKINAATIDRLSLAIKTDSANDGVRIERLALF